MEDRELSIREHLEELRRRLLIVAVALVVFTGLAFAFYKPILRLLLLPIEEVSPTGGSALVYTQLTEMFGVIMKTALVAGMVFSLPVLLYQVVMFVGPALTARERAYLYLFLPGALVAFVGGATFGYFILLPPALRFLLQFGGEFAQPMIRIGDYANTVVMVLFWIGLAFETPLVMFLLARLGVVKPRRFSQWRRYWVLVAFILGAMITPTFDPVNQTLVAGPLIVLYELGILLAKVGSRSRRATVQQTVTAPHTPGE